MPGEHHKAINTPGPSPGDHHSSHQLPRTTPPLSLSGTLQAGLGHALCLAGPWAVSEVGFRGHSITPASCPISSSSKQPDILF